MFYFTQVGTIISQYMPPTHFQEAQWVICTIDLEFTVYADVRVSWSFDVLSNILSALPTSKPSRLWYSFTYRNYKGEFWVADKNNWIKHKRSSGNHTVSVIQNSKPCFSMLVSCTRAVWISEKMMQTSSSCKSLNCGSRRRSANSMYDRGIDSVIPSANVNNDESATVELCWRRPSGLTIDHKHRHRKKKHAN